MVVQIKWWASCVLCMVSSLTECRYRDAAVSSVQEEEDDSVSDPSDLSSDEDDLVGEEIHF